MAERFYWRQTGARCFTVFDGDALTLSTAKGRRNAGRVASYFTRKRAEFCVWRLRNGRQKSPYRHRLERMKAWPGTNPI